jgi:surfeit locus 1 family protein
MKRAFLLLLFLAAAIGFAALGVWQLERRAWKLDLIARVDARIQAVPVPVPAPAGWKTIHARDHEYRRVRLTGRFQHERAALVDALTAQGAGFWVLTPLVTDAGIILVNRGFVPAAQKDDYARPPGTVAVTGLMRMPEPGGRFLRPNRPGADLWYSRDVVAIAARRNLGPIAPFFVDEEKSAGASYPVGGLTVVRFRNAHLTYAIIWIVLALLAGAGAWRVARHSPNHGQE